MAGECFGPDLIRVVLQSAPALVCSGERARREHSASRARGRAVKSLVRTLLDVVVCGHLRVRLDRRWSASSV